ncbi:MAG: hypothetical protein H6Q68_568 [Firmicutes bacterium]|nr:hypothetical protein [Bacillota bacterium]
MSSCIELLKELIAIKSVDRHGANSLIDYCEELKELRKWVENLFWQFNGIQE